MKIGPITLMMALLFAPFWIAGSVSAGTEEPRAERIARMAMSTASLWMVEHHEHEILESIEKGDYKEAIHEAEEVIQWMKGAPWLPELQGNAEKAIKATQALVNVLGTSDRKGLDGARSDLKEAYHHLHHELMELVAEGSGAPAEHDH